MGSSTMSNSAPFLMSISSSLFSSPPCSFKAFSKLKREGSPKYRWTMRPFWYHLFLAPIHSWRNLSHLLRNLHHQLLLQLLRQLLQDWMAFHKVLKPPLFLHPFLLCFLDLMKIFTFSSISSINFIARSLGTCGHPPLCFTGNHPWLGCHTVNPDSSVQSIEHFHNHLPKWDDGLYLLVICHHRPTSCHLQLHSPPASQSHFYLPQLGKIFFCSSTTKRMRSSRV